MRYVSGLLSHVSTGGEFPQVGPERGSDRLEETPPYFEGLNGVNRQPSNGEKSNRQPSKMENFNRQPSINPGKISRQRS